MKNTSFVTAFTFCSLCATSAWATPHLTNAQITKLNNDKALAHATLESLIYPNGVARTGQLGLADTSLVATLLTQETAILYDIDNDDNGQPINKSEIPLAVESAQNQIVVQVQVIYDILKSEKFAELSRNLPTLEASLANSYITLDNEVFNNTPTLAVTFFTQEVSMEATGLTGLLEIP